MFIKTTTRRMKPASIKGAQDTEIADSLYACDRVHIVRTDAKLVLDLEQNDNSGVSLEFCLVPSERFAIFIMNESGQTIDTVFNNLKS